MIYSHAFPGSANAYCRHSWTQPSLVGCLLASDESVLRCCSPARNFQLPSLSSSCPRVSLKYSQRRSLRIDYPPPPPPRILRTRPGCVISTSHNSCRIGLISPFPPREIARGFPEISDRVAFGREEGEVVATTEWSLAANPTVNPPN